MLEIETDRHALSIILFCLSKNLVLNCIIFNITVKNSDTDAIGWENSPKIASKYKPIPGVPNIILHFTYVPIFSSLIILKEY